MRPSWILIISFKLGRAFLEKIVQQQKSKIFRKTGLELDWRNLTLYRFDKSFVRKVVAVVDIAKTRKIEQTFSTGSNQ